jgi:ABC-2 type transport system permease protein
MGPTAAIARRELGAFFKSPVAYIVLTVFVALTGALFFKDLFDVQAASMSRFFDNLPLIFLFFGPAIAMRLVAEEKGSGSIELLLTMPVRDTQVVLGKYLAALGLLLVAIILTVPFAITVSRLGPLDWGATLGGYLGMFLLGATYIAAGLFASTMTRNQVVAFVVGLAICFIFFLMGQFAAAAGPLAPVIQYLSPQVHFSKIARGVIELKNIVYYLSAIAILLLASVQVLESRKWR